MSLLTLRKSVFFIPWVVLCVSYGLCRYSLTSSNWWMRAGSDGLFLYDLLFQLAIASASAFLLTRYSRWFILLAVIIHVPLTLLVGWCIAMYTLGSSSTIDSLADYSFFIPIGYCIGAMLVGLLKGIQFIYSP